MSHYKQEPMSEVTKIKRAGSIIPGNFYSDLKVLEFTILT